MKNEKLKFVTIILDLIIIVFLIWTIFTGGLIQTIVVPSDYCNGVNLSTIVNISGFNVSENFSISVDGVKYEATS